MNDTTTRNNQLIRIFSVCSAILATILIIMFFHNDKKGYYNYQYQEISAHVDVTINGKEFKNVNLKDFHYL